MKIKKIKIKGKLVEARVCDNVFSRARGLMFRRNSLPLLFVFKKPGRYSIHSFFCKPFRAVWMRGGKILEEGVVRPFSFSIKPKKPFTHLLEIPFSRRWRNI